MTRKQFLKCWKPPGTAGGSTTIRLSCRSCGCNFRSCGIHYCSRISTRWRSLKRTAEMEPCRNTRLWSRVSRLNRTTSIRSEEHTSELQSLAYLVCRLLLETKKADLAVAGHTAPDACNVLNGPPWV